MDYAKIASQVIENVGGKQNIKSVQHCATRLRLQLKNNDLRNEEAVSDIEGVKGVFLTQSQFQIIFGSGLVNLVCDEVQKQLGIAVDTSADDEKEHFDSSNVSWKISDRSVSTVERPCDSDQLICKCTIYILASTDRIQCNKEIWWESISWSSHGYDHGSSRSVKCIQHRYRQSASMGYLWI